jgi:hypothetical protein
MKLPILTGLVLAVLLFVVLPAAHVSAQSEPQRIGGPEYRMSNLEQQFPQQAFVGALLVLVGASCALWAQNTGRRAWLWFFLGVFFNVVTLLVLLYKNANDKARPVPVAH